MVVWNLSTPIIHSTECVSNLASGQFASVSAPHATATLKMVLLGRCPAFHAMVNGHDAILELDTGSFELRLGPQFMAKNHLDPSSVDLTIGDFPSISLKPVVEALAEPDRPTLADRFAVKVDGIVGLDVLRTYAIGLDMVANQISFWPGGKVGPEFAARWTDIGNVQDQVPLSQLDLFNRKSDDWFLTLAKVNGHPVDLILDTGTAVSTVNPSLVRKLELRKIAETEVEEIGKTELLPVMAADSLTFGSASAEYPILNVESKDDPGSDGILGTMSLGSGKFLVDMPALKFYVRQDRNGGHRNPLEQRLGSAGLDVFPDSANQLIVLVRAGSAADKAGIRTGDVVTRFGKVDVTYLTASEGDAQTSQKMLSLGLAFLQKDLTITVTRKNGTQATLPLPPITKN